MKKFSSKKDINKNLNKFAHDIILSEIKKTYNHLTCFPNNPWKTEYLSMLMASILIEKEQVHQREEGYISLLAFWEKYRICSASHICRIINQYPLFASYCAKRSGRRWYIRPETAINFLASARIGQLVCKRCENWLRQNEDKLWHVNFQ